MVYRILYVSAVLECVASFLEDPTEQEPSDAETLSSHSTDSDSDGDTTQDDLTVSIPQAQ